MAPAHKRHRCGIQFEATGDRHLVLQNAAKITTVVAGQEVP